MFLHLLAIAKAKYHVEIYGYCLTSNHVHLLLGTPEEANLSKFMQYVNGNFAQAYNKKYGKTGRFWGGRFYSTVIESETQFFNTLLYIEFNMVRCRVVSDPSDWQWSSYNAHAYGKSDPILDDHALYQALGPTPQARQEAYQQMAADSMAEKGYKEPSFSVGVILGSESFVCSLLEKYGQLTRFYHNHKIYAFQEGSGYSLHRTARPLKDTS